MRLGNRTVGEVLAQLRANQGLSGNDVAAAANMDAGHIRKIEKAPADSDITFRTVQKALRGVGFEIDIVPINSDDAS
jgi:transcriptional regulator with XRE-family HTH domain